MKCRRLEWPTRSPATDPLPVLTCLFDVSSAPPQTASPVEFMAGVRPLVRHEHERWDGAGYPDGLAGEAIPLGSRIILACDALHAMTSDRPYRRALPPDLAITELRRNAGTQFDPRVVDALLGLLALV